MKSNVFSWLRSSGLLCLAAALVACGTPSPSADGALDDRSAVGDSRASDASELDVQGPSDSDAMTDPLDAVASDAASIDAPSSSDSAAPGDATPPRDANAADASTSNDGAATDDLRSLPRDTGGTHLAVPIGTGGAPYGHYVYLPSGYSGGTDRYPVLIFLHGQGERGNGASQLGDVRALGVPQLIERGMWAPRYPMIVVSPQYPDETTGNRNNWGGGSATPLRTFIEYVMRTYRVNERRIYLTGLSHGGNGVYDYLVLQSDATSYIAAAAPVAAWGPSRGFAMARNTPIWVFVGSADTQNFNNSRTFVTGYNAQMPAPSHRARFTVYPGAGHDVWTRTYNLSGMTMTTDPMFDPYSPSLYDWFFQFRR